MISTGKADWAHDISSVSDSLAKYISSSESHLHSSSKHPKSANGSRDTKKVAGVYPYPPSGRLSILNGSHKSQSEDPDTHGTVLVLPDYVAISEVPQSALGATAFWKYALDPDVPRAGTVPSVHAYDASNEDEEGLITKGFKTYTLPYNCLILLCSHKKRDARCHIAAMRLEAGKYSLTCLFIHKGSIRTLDFMHQLEAEGWQVDTDLEDLASSNPPLESTGQTKA